MPAILLYVGSRARTFKEAQANVSVLLFVVSLHSGRAAVHAAPEPAWIVLVPVSGAVLAAEPRAARRGAAVRCSSRCRRLAPLALDRASRSRPCARLLSRESDAERQVEPPKRGAPRSGYANCARAAAPTPTAESRTAAPAGAPSAEMMRHPRGGRVPAPQGAAHLRPGAPPARSRTCAPPASCCSRARDRCVARVEAPVSAQRSRKGDGFVMIYSLSFVC